MTERKRKRYAETFKREAIEYLISSGKSKLQVAKELGVTDSSLQLPLRHLMLPHPKNRLIVTSCWSSSESRTGSLSGLPIVDVPG